MAPQECGQTLSCEPRSLSLVHRASISQASFDLVLGQAISVCDPKDRRFSTAPKPACA